MTRSLTVSDYSPLTTTINHYQPINKQLIASAKLFASANYLQLLGGGYCNMGVGANHWQEQANDPGFLNLPTRAYIVSTKIFFLNEPVIPFIFKAFIVCDLNHMVTF